MFHGQHRHFLHITKRKHTTEVNQPQTPSASDVAPSVATHENPRPQSKLVPFSFRFLLAPCNKDGLRDEGRKGGCFLFRRFGRSLARSLARARARDSGAKELSEDNSTRFFQHVTNEMTTSAVPPPRSKRKQNIRRCWLAAAHARCGKTRAVVPESSRRRSVCKQRCGYVDGCERLVRQHISSGSRGLGAKHMRAGWCTHTQKERERERDFPKPTAQGLTPAKSLPLTEQFIPQHAVVSGPCRTNIIAGNINNVIKLRIFTTNGFYYLETS